MNKFLLLSVGIVLLFLVTIIYAFDVSSSSQSAIEIVDVSLSSIKVKPGDNLTVTAEIRSLFGVSSVTADMGGIETIELKLKEGNVYQGTWQNSWLVHSTEEKNYTVTLFVRDNAGNELVDRSLNFVDPSTVGTSTYQYATSYPYQRKTFYAITRHWVFYTNGTNLGFASSTDGSSWSAFTGVRACTAGSYFSIAFDGTYVHYTYAYPVSNNALYYRRGTPNSDGTITWSDEQTAIAAVSGVYFSRPTIAADSGGYPWIGYLKGTATTWYPYITKSSTKDNGVWTTADGFPYLLKNENNAGYTVIPVPLTSLKLYALYVSWSGPAHKGQLWDGSAWGSEETVPADSSNGIGEGQGIPRISATNEGDHVHYAFEDWHDLGEGDYAYHIHYFKRTYGTGWGSSENVYSTSGTQAPVLSITGSTVYCFWMGTPTADHGYYKKRVAGTWDTNPTDWITETTTLTGNNRLTCFYQAYNNIIGLAYMTATNSPYNVRYAYLDVAPPLVTIQSPTNTTYTTTSVWANVTLNEAGSWCGRSLDGAANVTMTNSTGNYNNQMTSLGQGSHNVRFYCNDTAGNMNGSSSNIKYFTVDTTPPLWQNQGTNDTDNSILQGQAINLTAQGKDETALDWAWLATNETGVWQNKTGGSWQDTFSDSSKIASSQNITVSGGDVKIELSYATNSTTKSCNVAGSASSTGVKCTNGALKCNEDSTYATMDSCRDGSACVSNNMYVTNIFINGTNFAFGDSINVICEFNPYGSTDYYAIAYNNGTGWKNKAYGSMTGGVQNKSTSFILDNVTGTHYVRCIYNYYDATTSATTCGGTWGTYGVSYSDTDDMNFTVVAGGYKSSANLTSTAITGITWDKFYANDTVSASQGTNITYKILKASDNSTLCSGLTGDGDDISSCVGIGTSIRLFANLTTTNTSNTPTLSDWNVSWSVYNSPMDMNNAANVWTWSNFTWSNSSVAGGTTVGWKIYYNDTSGNENTTDIATFRIIDTTAPTITIQSPLNQTYNSSSQSYSIWSNVTLNKAGSWCGVSLDGAANNSLTNSTGNWNSLMTITSGSHNVKFYCNNTDGYMGNTTERYFTLNTPPLWQNPGTNDTDNTINQGEAINLTAQGKDETALDWAWLATNETGAWQNKTQTTLTVSDTFTDETKVAVKTNVSVNTTAGNVKLTIPSGSASTVGTSTSEQAVRYPGRRAAFYANGRFWVWYSNGTDMGYSTSTDGSTWSSFTSIRLCNNGHLFSIHFDGTYVHYAYGSGDYNTDLFYRRGIPNSDGTITWSAAEQIAVAAQSNIWFTYPSVITDSAGYPWIGYPHSSGGVVTPYVTKSSMNNGTWATASGFPYALTTGSAATNLYTILVPLTSQRILAIYTSGYNQTVKAKLWNGAWGSGEQASSSNFLGAPWFSAVNQSDDVHLTFTASNNDIIYVRRNYSASSWSSEVTVQSSTGYYAPSLSINTANNNLYCFWTGHPTANHIYYKKYNGAAWDSSPTDWITETVLPSTDNDRLRSYYNSYGGKIGLVYMNSAYSPYQVRFSYLSFSYHPSGELWSTNLLSGLTVSSIDSFGYNATIPSGTSLKVQFSQDNSTWYNSTGSSGGWNNLTQGANTISLSSLGWSGANFYYKIQYTSNGTNTPTLDDVNVSYTQKFYNSPMDMQNAANTWTWSNFTWSNSSVAGTTVGWRIYYNDTSGNENATNITTFRIRETTAPQWSNNNTSPLSPATYSSGANYQFNITWTDTFGVDDVILEFSSVNYSYKKGELSKSNNEYYKTLTDLVANSYSYKWYANDTSDNWNSTATWSYVIDKATLQLSITADQTVTYPTQTTVTPAETNTGDADVNYTLFRNDTGLISTANGTAPSADTATLGVGSYLYTFNTTSDLFENYTANSTGVTSTVTVNQNSTNPIDIYLINSIGAYKNQNITIIYGEQTTANVTPIYSNSGTVALYEDGSSVSNPRTTALSLGEHSYKGNITGNTNYTSNFTGATYYIKVDQAPAYSLNSTNTILAGAAVEHSLNWTDNFGLSGYIFSFDNCTGTLVNSTWSSFGASTWSNVTKNINSTEGCTVRWCIYANDTSNNWNGTSCSNPFSYTTVAAPPYTIIGIALDYFTGLPIASGVVKGTVKETGEVAYASISNGYFTLSFNSTANATINKFTLGLIVNSSDNKIGYVQLVSGYGEFVKSLQTCSIKEWHFTGRAVDTAGMPMGSGNVMISVVGELQAYTNSTTFSNGLWNIYISPCLIPGNLYTFQITLSSGEKISNIFIKQIAK
jgi:hypothetical protein